MGVTGRPVDFIQVGLSYTTPSYYQITETYDADMSANWKNYDYYGDGRKILTNQESATDIVTSDYSLTIPGKLSAGVAFLSKYA